MLSKLPKSFSKNRSIIYYIYSFNIFYSQYIIRGFKENNIPSEYTERPKNGLSGDPTTFNSFSERRKKNIEITKYKLNVVLHDKKSFLVVRSN